MIYNTSIKRKSINIFAIISISIFLQSCTGLIQKAYLPTPQGICNFEEKGDMNLKFNGNISVQQVQYNYAYNDHWGLTSKILYSYKNKSSFNLGVVRYKNYSNKYFELSGGFGYANINSKIKDRPVTSYLKEYYSHDIQSEYYSLYLQPSISFQTQSGSLFGFSLNFNNLYYTKYDYKYKLEPYRGLYQYLPDIEWDTLSKKNFYTSFIEPTLTLQTNKDKINFSFQLGYSFSTIQYVNHNYFIEYQYINSSTSNPNLKDYEFLHPRYRHLILNLGIIIKLDK
ncbi:MAG: hypothetical protein K9J13_17715 [Saprospiraceae bacterium]|nr:hypothetical protein [Saprospiraceae bacterium]